MPKPDLTTYACYQVDGATITAEYGTKVRIECPNRTHENGGCTVNAAIKCQLNEVEEAIGTIRLPYLAAK